MIQGTAEFIDNNTINVEQEDGFQLLQFNDVIISTGSRPIEIPSFPFGGRIIDSTGALSLPEVPKHLIIVGEELLVLSLVELTVCSVLRLQLLKVWTTF